ncbi:MAG: BlaI/MecI/CopY family transcriptional regulator [Puniceicoccaceae bacterium]
MARPKTKKGILTDLEMEIMQIIWSHSVPSDVETISAQLETRSRKLAPPSIRTMLGILEEKGFVSRSQEGRRHCFTAKITRPEAQQNLLGEVVDTAFQGSPSALFAALLGSDKLKASDLETIRSLIDKSRP